MFIVRIEVHTQIHCEAAMRRLWVAGTGSIVSSTGRQVAAVLHRLAASDTATGCR